MANLTPIYLSLIIAAFIFIKIVFISYQTSSNIVEKGNYIIGKHKVTYDLYILDIDILYNCMDSCKICQDSSYCQKCYTGFKYDKINNKCIEIEGQECEICEKCNDCPECIEKECPEHIEKICPECKDKECPECIEKECPEQKEIICPECKETVCPQCIEKECPECVEKECIETTCPECIEKICPQCEDKQCPECIQNICPECKEKICPECNMTVSDSNPCEFLECQNCHQDDQSQLCKQCSKIQWKQYEQACHKQCPESTYFNEQSNICENCKVNNCQICVNSLNQCQQCQPQYKLNNIDSQNQECQIECPQGEYLKDGICQKCEVNECQFCQGDGNICEECFENHYLYNNQCYEQQCPDNSYLKDQTQRICQKCADQCLNCENEYDQCINCQEGYFYIEQDQKCVKEEQCPNGQYGDKNTQNCENCIENCDICKERSDNCLQCNENTFLNDKLECNENCEKSFYKNEENRTCQKCINYCLDCISDKQCNQCEDNYIFDENQQQCVIGCGDLCEDCQNQICNKCKQSYFLQNGDCVQQCKIGNYINQDTQKCEHCQANCQECTTENNCNQCMKSFYKLKISNEEQKCVGYNECGQNKFASDNGNCEDCKENCSDCKSNQVCDECQEGFYMQFDQNICIQKDQCKQGTYGNDKSRKCEQCSIKNFPQECQNSFKLNRQKQCIEINQCGEYCEKCVNQQCQYCSEGYYLNENFECVDQCPQRFFPESGKCQKCLDNCYECDNYLVCKQCEESFNLSQDKKICIQTCGEQQYNTPNGQCRNCDKSCDTCDINGCLKCRGNDQLIERNALGGIKKQICAPCQSNECYDHNNQQCVQTCPNNAKCVQGQCFAKDYKVLNFEYFVPQYSQYDNQVIKKKEICIIDDLHYVQSKLLGQSYNCQNKVTKQQIKVYQQDKLLNNQISTKYNYKQNQGYTWIVYISLPKQQQYDTSHEKLKNNIQQAVEQYFKSQLFKDYGNFFFVIPLPSTEFKNIEQNKYFDTINLNQNFHEYYHYLIIEDSMTQEIQLKKKTYLELRDPIQGTIQITDNKQAVMGIKHNLTYDGIELIYSKQTFQLN